MVAPRKLIALLLMLASSCGAVAVEPAVQAQGAAASSFSIVFDRHRDVDQSTSPPLPLPTFPSARVLAGLPKAEPQTGTFVDSQGRSLLYRYSLPDGVNAQQPQPVLIYCHGNNSATQQEIVDSIFPGVAIAAPSAA